MTELAESNALRDDAEWVPMLPSTRKISMLPSFEHPLGVAQ